MDCGRIRRRETGKLKSCKHSPTSSSKSTSVTGPPGSAALRRSRAAANGLRMRSESEFTYGNAQTRRDVHLAVILHAPACLFKLPIDLLPGLLLGSHSPPWCLGLLESHSVVFDLGRTMCCFFRMVAGGIVRNVTPASNLHAHWVLSQIRAKLGTN